MNYASLRQLGDISSCRAIRRRAEQRSEKLRTGNYCESYGHKSENKSSDSTVYAKGMDIKMVFAEKLKEARKKAGLTQRELAEQTGISCRAIQTWEAGTPPKSLESVRKVAQTLGTTSEALLSETDQYIVEAAEKGGAAAARDVDALVNEVIGLFAGGEIDEEEKDGIMAALNEAYWIAKRKNQKYTPKKCRGENE